MKNLMTRLRSVVSGLIPDSTKLLTIVSVPCYAFCSLVAVTLPLSPLETFLVYAWGTLYGAFLYLWIQHQLSEFWLHHRLSELSPFPEETDCPSCHGLNISCPEGCERDPETGELIFMKEEDCDNG